MCAMAARWVVQKGVKWAAPMVGCSGDSKAAPSVLQQAGHWAGSTGESWAARLAERMVSHSVVLLAQLTAAWLVEWRADRSVGR